MIARYSVKDIGRTGWSLSRKERNCGGYADAKRRQKICTKDKRPKKDVLLPGVVWQ
jgi:hypothetical protein